MLIKSCVVNIVAFIYFITQANSHFSRQFNNLIETRSSQFSYYTYWSLTNRYQAFRLNFQQSKNSAAYTFAIAHQQLEIAINSCCYSIYLQSLLTNPQSLEFKFATQCNNLIYNIRLRYLLVMPDMAEHVLISYFQKVYSGGELLQSSNNKNIEIQFSIPTLQNPRVISVLSGFSIRNKKSGGGGQENNYIDLSLKSMISGSIVKVQVIGLSSIQQIYLYRINIYTIVVPDKFIIGNLTGSFQTGIIPQSESKTSTNFLYSPKTVFVGVSWLTNQYKNNKIYYDVSINPTQISITSTNNKDSNLYQVSYINFIYLPCNLTKLYFYQPNTTCIDTCPISCEVYLVPYLCGQCSACGKKMYPVNSTCLSCKQQCSSCNSQVVCTACIEKYQLINDTCVPNCTLIANRTFLRDNLTCQPCASTCLQCSNATYCSVCNSSYFLSSGECLPNCTLFDASTFLQNKTCTSCNKSCLTCLNLTHCLSCIDLYKFQSNTCVVNCTLSLGCLQCRMAPNSFIYCTKCVPGLLPYSGVCENKCGDGSYRGSQQECDDGNVDSGDGCSATCSVEQQYWSCSSSQGSVSACVLKRIDVLSSFVLKDPKSNSISVHFGLFPTPLILDDLQWERAITTPTGKALLKCTKGYYDRSTSKLILELQYQSDLSGLQAEILFDFSKVDSKVALAPSKTAKVSMVAENNLSLSVYSAQIYLLNNVIESISLSVAILSLLMFLCGFLSGKLIALQNLAIVQLTFLCQLDIKEANPTFEALRILRVSIGSLPFDTYDYSSSIDRSFKGSYIGLGLLQPPNFSYFFIVLPIFIGTILLILHKIKWKKSKTLQIISLTFIGQVTFYGLIFSSYLIFSKLLMGIVSLGSVGLDYIVNIVFSGLLTLIVGIYCILFIRHPQNFGIFTHSFSRFGIVSNFYILVIIQKFISTSIIIVLRDTSFGLGIQISIILLLFISVLVKKPYIGLDYRRQKINYMALLLIVTLLLVSKILIGNEIIQNYIPLGICLLLLMSSISNVVYIIKSIKKTISQLCPKQSQTPENNPSFLQKMFNIKNDQTIQQKNQAQFQLFQRRLLGDPLNMSLLFKQQTSRQIQGTTRTKMKLDYQWEQYDKLQRNKFIQDIRIQIGLKTLKGEAI